MRSVLAFGDSNTWGLVPGSADMERYPPDVRWTGVLQRTCRGILVIEEGLCGRTTVFEDALRPGRKGVSALPGILARCRPLDAAILMLGTNDCKSRYGASPLTIGRGIEACLDELKAYLPADRVLLVSPLLLGEDVCRPDKDPEFDRRSVAVCRALKEVYARIAGERGCAFLAASDFASAHHADDEHMDAGGHRLFAAAVCGKLAEMGVI